jgi:Cys-rich protein (TIGR01571 family)
MATAVVIQQQGPSTFGMPLPKQNAWTTEVFDMCAMPGGAGRAIYALLFPGCAHGDMAAIAPPGSVMCAGNCCGACCVWGCCGVLVTCMASQSLRTFYGLEGSLATDLLAGLCTPCGILQQGREVNIRRAHTSTNVIMMPTIIAAPATEAMFQPVK